MKNLLYLFQILVAGFLILSILLQKRGSAFGGEVFYPTKRGLEKKVFWATIIFGILFVVLALLNLIL